MRLIKKNPNLILKYIKEMAVNKEAEYFISP